MSDPNSAAAVSVCFKVEIDACPLGTFISCEGIGLEVTMEQREEGGNNGFIHQLPGRIKYSNVKLTRPVNADTAKVAAWFAKMAGAPERTTARIVAMTFDSREIWHWSLKGVLPVRWQGPSMSVESAKVATETLELAHHGFLAG
jgi:phage tail-like protein